MSLTIVFLLSPLAGASGSDNCYLQVASFKSEGKAVNYALSLKNEGQDALVKVEEIKTRNPDNEDLEIISIMLEISCWSVLNNTTDTERL